MKKIGIIFGMETTFPPALVEKINSMGEPDIQAELAVVGEVRMAEPSPYHVIVDRISHDIPFYRGYLKNAALVGTFVINNPFWWSADDKFFNYALGDEAGCGHSADCADPAQGASAWHHRPLHAQPAVSHALGQHLQLRRIPAFLKPFDGGGWKDVYKVNSPEEFFNAYDQSRDLCMTLQRGVKFKEYFRCYVVGQEKVHIMHYDPSAPFHERYVKNPPPTDPKLLAAGGARLPHSMPRPRLRPEHGRVCLRRRHSLRYRLHESCARR